MLVSTVNRHDEQKIWQVVSYTSDLHRLQEVMLGTEAARDQLNGAFQQLMQVGARPAGLRRSSRGSDRVDSAGCSERREPPPPPPPTIFGNGGRIEPFNWLVSPFPWTYSAGVLAGLVVLSLWTLSTRVKSLDRLR